MKNISGQIQSFKEVVTHKKDIMAFGTMKLNGAELELIFFPTAYEKLKSVISQWKDKEIIFLGQYDAADSSKFLVDQVTSL